MHSSPLYLLCVNQRRTHDIRSYFFHLASLTFSWQEGLHTPARIMHNALFCMYNAALLACNFYSSLVDELSLYVCVHVIHFFKKRASTLLASRCGLKVFTIQCKFIRSKGTFFIFIFILQITRFGNILHKWYSIIKDNMNSI